MTKTWFEIEIPHHSEGCENWNGSEFVIGETTEFTKEQAEIELKRAQEFCERQGWVCEPVICKYHD